MFESLDTTRFYSGNMREIIAFAHLYNFSRNKKARYREYYR
jgi:hypothetical protein